MASPKESTEGIISTFDLCQPSGKDFGNLVIIKFGQDRFLSYQSFEESFI